MVQRNRPDGLLRGIPICFPRFCGHWTGTLRCVLQNHVSVSLFWPVLTEPTGPIPPASTCLCTQDLSALAQPQASHTHASPGRCSLHGHLREKSSAEFQSLVLQARKGFCCRYVCYQKREIYTSSSSVNPREGLYVVYFV